MKVMRKNKYIESLFEGKSIRNLYEDEAGMPPARYSMTIKASDLLSEEEKALENRDQLVKDRVNELVQGLAQSEAQPNPIMEVCYEITLDETAMANPEVKNIISQNLDKYKNQEGENNEIEIG